MNDLTTDLAALKKSTRRTADLAIEYNQKVNEFRSLLDAFCKPGAKPCLGK